MSTDEVLTERHGKTLVITMNRPKANAINPAFSRALYAVYYRLQNYDSLVCGILMSWLERIFCAGYDLKEQAQEDWDPAADFHPDTGLGPGGFGGMAENWALDKPLIAAVHGAVVGGGFEMALGCDVIIAAEDSYFLLPEMLRGFLPDVGGYQWLTRKIPINVAVEMILTGRRMEVDEAERWGLVHKIVPRSELKATALEMADRIALGAPLALRAFKAMVRATQHVSIEEALDRAKRNKSRVPIFEQMTASEDAIEGPRAFAEKRAPKWKGK